MKTSTNSSIIDSVLCVVRFSLDASVSGPFGFWSYAFCATTLSSSFCSQVFRLFIYTKQKGAPLAHTQTNFKSTHACKRRDPKLWSMRYEIRFNSFVHILNSVRWPTWRAVATDFVVVWHLTRTLLSLWRPNWCHWNWLRRIIIETFFVRTPKHMACSDIGRGKETWKMCG